MRIQLLEDKVIKGYKVDLKESINKALYNAYIKFEQDRVDIKYDLLSEEPMDVLKRLGYDELVYMENIEVPEEELKEKRSYYITTNVVAKKYSKLYMLINKIINNGSVNPIVDIKDYIVQIEEIDEFIPMEEKLEILKELYESLIFTLERKQNLDSIDKQICTIGMIIPMNKTIKTLKNNLMDELDKLTKEASSNTIDVNYIQSKLKTSEKIKKKQPLLN